MSIPRIFYRPDRIPAKSHGELVTLLIAGRLPILIMAITILATSWLAWIEAPEAPLIAMATVILGLLVARAILVTRFIRTTRERSLQHDEMRHWEACYSAIVVPYAAVLGLFNFHLANWGDDAVRILVVAETYGFCAGMVSRGFVRPKLCALMVLLGALPTAAGLLALAARSTGTTAVSFGLVGALFVLYAFSSLETVNHLYKAMIAQITIKHHFATVARTDALTGLANRVAMSELLMEIQAGTVEASALLLIDLDGFKAVNDRLGHPAGDQLLKRVAGVISGTLRPDDIAVRMGGDEFAVVQMRCAGPHETLALAERIVRSIGETASGPFSDVKVGACIGISTFEGAGEDIEDVINRADRALYRAKNAGGDAVRVWREEPALAMVA